MVVGVSTAAFFCRKMNIEALPLLKEVGAETAEVFLTSISEYKPSFGQQLALSNPSLPIHSVHVLTTQIEPHLFNPHPLPKMDSFRILEDAMITAQKIGAKYYTFHGIARAKKTARDGNNDNFRRLGSVTGETFDFCKKFGVTLCQENVEWATYNRPGVFTKLKAYCPKLKGVLDLKQARLSGYSYEAYLKEMGSDITHVHVSDIDESGKMCLPGKGIFDFDRLIGELKEVGFTGPLIIEPYPEDYESLDDLKESVEFLKEKSSR